MPGIKIPTESLKPPKSVQPGIYSLRLDGFEPGLSQKSKTVNFCPVMVIVNNQEYHGKRQMEWLNIGFGRAVIDFLHCFGEQVGGTPESPEFPGFDNSEDPDPKKWRYVGPMVGRVGQVELAENAVDGKGTYINVKRYFCAIPNCKVKHSDNLLRS